MNTIKKTNKLRERSTPNKLRERNTPNKLRERNTPNKLRERSAPNKLRLLSLLLVLCMVATLLPVMSMTAFAATNDVTMEIPIYKTVELGTGSVAPGAKTFEFEVKPYGNSQANISSLTITGATIATDGAGNYTGTLKIVGDPVVIDNARGLKITEKNDGVANWAYDDVEYIVYRDIGNGMDILKDMGPNMNPQTVQTAAFTNTFTKDPTPPDPTSVTMEIPISKTVELGTGSVAPGAKTFEFEVNPYGNSQANISSLTITGATIATDGAGNYTGTLKIVGDPVVIDNARGLKITEKNDGVANWAYDDVEYIVYRDIGNGMDILKDMGPNMNPQTVQTAAFTNTFTKDPTPPDPTSVTMEIPISKTVELGTGSVAPGAKTFEFEVNPYGNSQANISSLTITGATIDTDGAGNYTGTLKIVGDPVVIDNARGLKITEKNDGVANWAYDDVEYIVYRDIGNGMDILKDMGPNMNPQTVQTAAFTNTFTKDPTPPDPTSVTMEIPISKTVELGTGSVAPGAKTFEFEVKPYGNSQANISSLTITGATIATDGAGNYTGTLKIVGDPVVIDNARGLKITEKNDGVANWAYDDVEYIVYRDIGNGMEIQKDMGPNMNPQSVQTAEFTNTYTKGGTTPPGGGTTPSGIGHQSASATPQSGTTDPAQSGQTAGGDEKALPPKTGDENNMIPLLALLLSLGGIGAAAGKRKKSADK